MYKQTALFKGLVLLLVFLTSSTCNPTPVLSNTLHNHAIYNVNSLYFQTIELSVLWKENLCLRINHYPQDQLIDLLPYNRLCNSNSPEINKALPPTIKLPPAPPGSITVQTNGKMLYIDQSLQLMRVFENCVEIRTIPVSTGLRMSFTPAFDGQISNYVNKFYSFGRHTEHAWYITKATGNIYIHSCPYTIIDGQKHYEGIEWLGIKPSSHGCVRIHPSDAEWLLVWDPLGVSLIITTPDFIKYPD
jgi:hypothetical protein